MRYNNIYRIIFFRLAIMLLPTMLRKPVIMAFLRAVYSQFDWIDFARYRLDVNYRLTHNGQVCYLRAVLNDKFDNELRRIQIGDGLDVQWSFIYHRDDSRKVLLPQRQTSNAFIIGRRGTATGSAFDFTILLPDEPRFHDTALLLSIEAVTREFKLASKQFQLTYLPTQN